VLDLPAARALLELDLDLRGRLFVFLSELKIASLAESDRAWRKHKGPIATYRYAIAVHAAVLARAVRPPRIRRLRTPAPEFLSPRDELDRPRATRAAVRNPVLALRSITLLRQAPACEQLRFHARSIAKVCADLAKDAWIARRREEALFWRATSVYAGHLSRALRERESLVQLAFPIAA